MSADECAFKLDDPGNQFQQWATLLSRHRLYCFARFDLTARQHVVYILAHAGWDVCISETEWRVTEMVVHKFGWEMAEDLLKNRMPTRWWRYLQPQCHATKATDQCGVCP